MGKEAEDRAAAAEEEKRQAVEAQARMERELKALQAELPSLDDLKREAGAARKAEQEAKAEAGKAKALAQAMGRELEMVKATNGQLGKAQGMASEEISRLRREVESAQRERASYMALLESAQKQTSVLTDEIHNLSSRLNESQSGLERLRNENVALKEEASVSISASLEADTLRDLSARLDATLDELAGIKQEELEHRSAIQSLTLEMDKVCEDRDAAEARARHLESQLAHLRDHQPSTGGVEIGAVSGGVVEDEEVGIGNTNGNGEGNGNGNSSGARTEMMKHILTLRQTILNTINDLRLAEEASESTLTCLSCMELFRDPVILPGCCHILCSTCAGESPRSCPECQAPNPHPETPLARVDPLETLASKWMFKIETLSSAKSSIDSSFASLYASLPTT